MVAAAANYLSIQGAAERLGVNDRSIRRWIAEGRLPAARVGAKVIRIRADDVDALLRPIPTARGGARA